MPTKSNIKDILGLTVDSLDSWKYEVSYRKTFIGNIRDKNPQKQHAANFVWEKSQDPRNSHKRTPKFHNKDHVNFIRR